MNKTPEQIALEVIAGTRAGLDQDISTLERWWPEAKRGSNARRAFASIVSRARSMTDIAAEQIAD